MTPARAATLFRQLLETPTVELPQFARRWGLPGKPAVGDLEGARELLHSLSLALESEPGPNWARIATARDAMLAAHGPLDLSAGGATPPAWVRALPAKPSLGDLAPGTAARTAQSQQRSRFVPPARAQAVAPPAAVPARTAPQPVVQAAPAPPRRPPPPRHAAGAPPAAAATGEPAVFGSVASYAALCAATAAQPERVAETQREYGIADEHARRRLDEAWQDRFDEQPALQQQWEQLFARLRGQLGRR